MISIFLSWVNVQVEFWLIIKLNVKILIRCWGLWDSICSCNRSSWINSQPDSSLYWWCEFFYSDWIRLYAWTTRGKQSRASSISLLNSASLVLGWSPPIMCSILLWFYLCLVEIHTMPRFNSNIDSGQCNWMCFCCWYWLHQNIKVNYYHLEIILRFVIDAQQVN